MKLLIIALITFPVLTLVSISYTESILIIRWLLWQEDPKPLRKKKYMQKIIFSAVATVVFIMFIIVKDYM